LNNHKAALAQGANGRHAGLGVLPETVSASSPSAADQQHLKPAGETLSLPGFLFLLLFIQQEKSHEKPSQSIPGKLL